MPSFTMALHEAIEVTGGTTEYIRDAEIPHTRFTPGDSTLGLMDYPIWDDEYREILNGKIIDQYWNREIGQETIDLFQLAMRRKLDQIMPIYNQLYQTTKLEYDPLSTINLTTTNTVNASQVTNNTGTNTTTSDSDSHSRSVNSDTPQTMLAQNEDYATAAVDANSQATGTSSAAEDSSSDTESNANGETVVKGYQAIPADLIAAYRANLLNIDLMIINDLADLFMLVWDTGDSYTETGNLLPYPLPYGRTFL